MVGEPLAGCVMVITADRRKSELASALERRGAHVRLAPALTTIHHLDDKLLVRVTRDLLAHPPDIVVATTGIGFRGWMEAAQAAGLRDQLQRVLINARMIARGPKARGAIEAAGLKTDWVAQTETAAELRDFLVADGVAGLHVAVQHHGAGSDGLDDAFTAAGATVTPLVVYGWGPPADDDQHRAWIEKAARGACDSVVFTSAPGAQAWVDTARADSKLEALKSRVAEGSLMLASVGPVTAGPLEREGLATRFPQRWRLGALVRDMVSYFGAEERGVSTPSGLLVVRNTFAVLDGTVLPLSPSGLAILTRLARARGSVVTRDELASVLPGENADGHALETAVARLRDAAGDRSLVKTVVKRGYALAVTTP